VNKRHALGLITVVAGFIGTIFNISPVFGLQQKAFLL